MYNIEVPNSPLPKFAPSRRVSGHFEACYCLAIDSTQQILVTGADDHIIKIWKIPELTLIQSITRCHEKEITEIAIHPRNTIFASSSYDGKICLFDLSKGEFISDIALEVPVYAIRFSPCGRYFAAAGGSGVIKVFSVIDDTSIELMFGCSIDRDCAWLSFSPGGSFLAVSADEGTLIVINIEKRKLIKLEGHKMTPDYVFFSKTSPRSIISIAMKERGLKEWVSDDSLWGRCLNFSTKSLSNIKNRLVCCRWNADDTRIVAISQNNLFVWDPLTKKTLAICGHSVYTDHCTTLAANPVIPNVVFIGTQFGMASLWDIEKGEKIDGFSVSEGGKINDAVWSQDGRVLYTVDQCGGVTVYECGTEKSVTTTQMFYRHELDDSADPHQTDFILAVNSLPLDPQPRRWYLETLRVTPTPITIDQYIIDEENKLKEKWNQIADKNSNQRNQRRRRRRGNGREEEEEEEEDQNENVERTVFSIMTNGTIDKGPSIDNLAVADADVYSSESSSSDTSDSDVQMDNTSSSSSSDDSPGDGPTMSTRQILREIGRSVRDRTRQSRQFSPPPRQKRHTTHKKKPQQETGMSTRTRSKGLSEELPEQTEEVPQAFEEEPKTEPKPKPKSNVVRQKRTNQSRLSPPREKRGAQNFFSSDDTSEETSNSEDYNPQKGGNKASDTSADDSDYYKGPRSKKGLRYKPSETSESTSSLSEEEPNPEDLIIAKKPVRRRIVHEENETSEQPLKPRVSKPVKFSSDDEKEKDKPKRKRVSAISPPPDRKKPRSYREIDNDYDDDFDSPRRKTTITTRTNPKRSHLFESDEERTSTISSRAHPVRSVPKRAPKASPKRKAPPSSDESDEEKATSGRRTKKVIKRKDPVSDLESSSETESFDDAPRRIVPPRALSPSKPRKTRKQQNFDDKNMWRLETDPDDLVFIPQVGERIVYIAHAFSIWRTKNNNRSQTPHSSNLSLTPFGFGSVTAAEHTDNGLNLTIRFDDDPTEYTIPFVPNTFPSYIIDEELFHASISSDFTVGHDYSFLHQGELHTSPLEAILPKVDQYETLKFKVRNKFNSFQSPWNILEVKVEPSEIQQLFSNSMAEHVKNIISNPKGAKQLVDCLSKPTIRNSNYPMSIRLIYERCANGWYRTTFQFHDDVMQLANIGNILGLKKADVNRVIKSLLTSMREVFDGFPLPQE